MSSRLNPRDYDLGELRDAVRESARRHDGPRGGRRSDGRRGARRDDRRAGDPTNGAGPAEAVRSHDGDSPVEARPSQGGSPTENGSSNGASPDDAPSSEADTGADADVRAEQAAEGQYPEDHGTGSHSAPEPSSDRRANRRAGTGRTADRRPAVGRMRRNRRRFARSSSRDRTADGASRRREAAGVEDARPEGDSAGRPGGHAYRSERARRSDHSGVDAPAQRSPGTRAGGFELLSAASSEDVERPYLDRLPAGYRAQVEIFAWLEELLATCGRESTLEALAYYEAVGWLSEESRRSLEDFVDGLTAAEPPDPRPLEVDDHRASLGYVARLARRVDP